MSEQRVFVVMWKSDDYNWNCDVFADLDALAEVWGGEGSTTSNVWEVACQARDDPGEEWVTEDGWQTVRYLTVQEARRNG